MITIATDQKKTRYISNGKCEYLVFLVGKEECDHNHQCRVRLEL